jgi:hypothetical protein
MSCNGQHNRSWTFREDVSLPRQVKESRRPVWREGQTKPPPQPSDRHIAMEDPSITERIAGTLVCVNPHDRYVEFSAQSWHALERIGMTCQEWRRAIHGYRRYVRRQLQIRVHLLPFTRGPYDRGLLVGNDREALVVYARSMWARVIAWDNDCEALYAALFARYYGIFRTEMFPEHRIDTPDDDSDEDETTTCRLLEWYRQLLANSREATQNQRDMRVAVDFEHALNPHNDAGVHLRWPGTGSHTKTERHFLHEALPNYCDPDPDFKKLEEGSRTQDMNIDEELHAHPHPHRQDGRTDVSLQCGCVVCYAADFEHENNYYYTFFPATYAVSFSNEQTPTESSAESEFNAD